MDAERMKFIARRNWLFPIVVAAVLVGCDDLSHLRDESQTLVVEVNDPKDAQTASRVLISRFREFPPSMFSSIRSDTTDRTIRFTFERGAPRPETLKFMTTNRGVLIAQARSGAIWFRERDIVEAAVVNVDGAFQLTLNLTDEAGARLDRLSRQNVGEIVTITLDGLELTTARVQAPLGKRLAISTAREPRALLQIAALLRHGPLPEGVRITRL